MKKTASMVRCVPRFGYENTEVRMVDLDLPRDAEEQDVLQALTEYFNERGIHEAVYDIAVDDNGYFAVVNDEVYDARWGKPLL